MQVSDNLLPGQFTVTVLPCGHVGRWLHDKDKYANTKQTDLLYFGPNASMDGFKEILEAHLNQCPVLTKLNNAGENASDTPT